MRSPGVTEQNMEFSIKMPQKQETCFPVMNSAISKTVMYFSKRYAVGLVGWEAERSYLSDTTHNIREEKFIMHSQ